MTRGAKDTRLTGRPRARLRAGIADGSIGHLGSYPPCMHPACKYPGVPIDYTKGARSPLAYDLDEIVPRYLGGDPLDPHNVRPSHRGCNARAGQRITTAILKRKRGHVAHASDSSRW